MKPILFETEGHEVIVKNLKDHFTTDQIGKKFINQGVKWMIFSNEYIFDTTNEDHTILLKELKGLAA